MADNRESTKETGQKEGFSRGQMVLLGFLAFCAVIACWMAGKGLYKRWHGEQEHFRILNEAKAKKGQPQGTDASVGDKGRLDGEPLPLARQIDIEESQDPEYKAFYGGTTAVDLACGLGGIVIGILITILVEHRNRIQGKQLNAQTRTIASTTDAINSNVERIIFNHTCIKAINDYDEVFRAIYGKNGVIEHATAKLNDLYIMNPTAWFGYWLSFDAEVLLGATDTKATDPISARCKGV